MKLGNKRRQVEYMILCEHDIVRDSPQRKKKSQKQSMSEYLQSIVNSDFWVKKLQISSK